MPRSTAQSIVFEAIGNGLDRHRLPAGQAAAAVTVAGDAEQLERAERHARAFLRLCQTLGATESDARRRCLADLARAFGPEILPRLGFGDRASRPARAIDDFAAALTSGAILGELVAARSTDIIAAYQAWCDRRGVVPDRPRDLIRRLAQEFGFRRARRRYLVDGKVRGPHAILHAPRARARLAAALVGRSIAEAHGACEKFTAHAPLPSATGGASAQRRIGEVGPQRGTSQDRGAGRPLREGRST